MKKQSRFIYEDEIVIIIPINPLPQKETAFAFRYGRKFAYTPQEKKDYMLAILPFLYPYENWAVKEDCIKAVFRFYKLNKNKVNIGKYWLNEMPDTDNLVKPIKDCLGKRKIMKAGSKGDFVTAAGVIWDDCQIVHETAMKMVSSQPRIEITLSKIIDTTKPRNKTKQQQLF